MTPEEKTIQATGIQARYDYNKKMLDKAVAANDEAKIIMLQGKVQGLKDEAESKGITIELGGAVQAPAAAPKKSNAASKGKASVKASADPEAEAAMAALDKGKNKKEGKATPKTPRKTHDCLCGCGQETLSLFAPGHDARVKGILLKVERGELTREDIPESVAPFVKFKGKWVKGGSDGFRMTACPVRIPGRSVEGADDFVAHTGVDALEALDV